MQGKEAIEYLDNMDAGKFLTINIPIKNSVFIPVTAMYVGKSKDGSYEFVDTGEMIISKEFLNKCKITIDREFNKNDAKIIYKRIKKEYAKAHKKKFFYEK